MTAAWTLGCVALIWGLVALVLVVITYGLIELTELVRKRYL